MTVRAPVNVSEVDDYLAGGRYGPVIQTDNMDRDMDIDRYRERQSSRTQRSGKNFNIQMNQQIMRVSDTREY